MPEKKGAGGKPQAYDESTGQFTSGGSHRQNASYEEITKADKEEYGKKEANARKLEEIFEEEAVKEVTDNYKSKMAKLEETKKKHPNSLIVERKGDYYEVNGELAEFVADLFEIEMQDGKQSVAFPYVQGKENIDKLRAFGEVVVFDNGKEEVFETYDDTDKLYHKGWYEKYRKGTTNGYRQNTTYEELSKSESDTVENSVENSYALETSNKVLAKLREVEEQLKSNPTDRSLKLQAKKWRDIQAHLAPRIKHGDNIETRNLGKDFPNVFVATLKDGTKELWDNGALTATINKDGKLHSNAGTLSKKAQKAFDEFAKLAKNRY